MFSLRAKFTLALLATSLLAILLVGVIARYVLLRQFSQVLFEQSFRAYKTDIAAYALTYGTLEKAFKSEPFRQFEMRRHALENGDQRDDRSWREGFLPGAPPPVKKLSAKKSKVDVPAAVLETQKAPPFRFLLLDLQGKAIMGAKDEFPKGTPIPDELRKKAEPINIKGKAIAYAVPLTTPNLNDLDLGYLKSVREALTYGTIGAALLAVLLGLFFGSYLSNNLRQLTDAINAMSKGDLRQNVVVRSRDEVGVLAKEFNRMSDELAEAHEQLKQEQEKAERLLLNILPMPVAERLKQNERVIADGFSEATVLFADLVGFTEYSAGKSPQEVVSLLNDIFSRFDELAMKHGLEKIKTMGDNYMAAAGIPLPQPHHAEMIGHMALDMQAVIKEFSAGERPLQMRIGINTGPVVAGVIGLNKFIYDLWGDAVNLASRMESQGLPGAIQVTASTHELLKDQFELRERGLVAVKGKGEMTTYLLLSRK